jgi:hypothetical protein
VREQARGGTCHTGSSCVPQDADDPLIHTVWSGAVRERNHGKPKQPSEHNADRHSREGHPPQGRTTSHARWPVAALGRKSLSGTCKHFNPPLRQPREDCGLDQLVHARRDGRTDEQQYDAEHEPSALTDLQ